MSRLVSRLKRYRIKAFFPKTEQVTIYGLGGQAAASKVLFVESSLTRVVRGESRKDALGHFVAKYPKAIIDSVKLLSG